jgi:hypothetical protein
MVHETLHRKLKFEQHEHPLPINKTENKKFEQHEHPLPINKTKKNHKQKIG